LKQDLAQGAEAELETAERRAHRGLNLVTSAPAIIRRLRLSYSLMGQLRGRFPIMGSQARVPVTVWAAAAAFL
jgi:hypothetical protein